MCSWCIMIRLVETPSTPTFICQGVGFTRKDRADYNLTQPGLYLYLAILQDLSIDYLLNCLGNGSLCPGFQVELANSWRPPVPSLHVQLA
jgi:hypothetical protein